MKIKETRKKILHYLGIHFAFLFINVLCKSLRIKMINGSKILEALSNKEPIIVAFWHGTMILPWYYLGNKNFSALVSLSNDGQILTNILSNWNYEVIRGSSNMGGKEALELMKESINNHKNIAITPDGPKGPKKKMKAGAVIISKDCGKKLFLVGAGLKKKKILKSWDSFEVPLPFTKAILNFSNGILIESSFTREEISEKIQELESELNLLQQSANEIAINN